MNGFCLKFYTYELQKHHGILLYEWLLEFARKNGMPGGSAFRGVAGFGRHGEMHEEHFFELASNVPVEVQFILPEESMNRFLDALKKEEINLVYTITQVKYGNINQVRT